MSATRVLVVADETAIKTNQASFETGFFDNRNELTCNTSSGEETLLGVGADDPPPPRLVLLAPVSGELGIDLNSAES